MYGFSAKSTIAPLNILGLLMRFKITNCEIIGFNLMSSYLMGSEKVMLFKESVMSVSKGLCGISITCEST